MKPELIISIASAVLSVLTFYLNLPKIKKEARARLHIKSRVSNDKNNLVLNLTNISYGRKITVIGFEVYYGVSSDYKQLLIHVPITPETLGESETLEIPYEVSNLRKAANENGIIQRYYHVLLVKVITTSSQTSLSKVEIPDNYFTDNPHYTAKNYMASDDLLGFPLKQPTYQRIHRPVK